MDWHRLSSLNRSRRCAFFTSSTCACSKSKRVAFNRKFEFTVRNTSNNVDSISIPLRYLEVLPWLGVGDESGGCHKWVSEFEIRFVRWMCKSELPENFLDLVLLAQRQRLQVTRWRNKSTKYLLKIYKLFHIYF